MFYLQLSPEEGQKQREQKEQKEWVKLKLEQYLKQNITKRVENTQTLIARILITNPNSFPFPPPFSWPPTGQ